MNLKELRTLRGQLLLTLGLFAGSLTIALVIVTNRWWFEGFLSKAYVDKTHFSANAEDVLNQANKGEIDPAVYEQLDELQRSAVYEGWMADLKNQSTEAPRALVHMDEKLYLRKVEQSVVCGSPEQQQRALRFLLLSHSPQTHAILNRLAAWAQRRRRADWFELIDQARREFSRTVTFTIFPNPISAS